MKTASLYKVEREDTGKLIALLTECFSSDPLYCQLIPQTEIRTKVLPEVFSCDLDELFETCQIYADSPQMNGIIIVSDETEPYNHLQYYATEMFCTIKMAMALIRKDKSCKTLARFLKGKDYLTDAWTKDIGDEERIHIVYFAVRPAMRGKGLAHRLMRTVLDYADKHNLLTSLETHNVGNVQMYRHYGFQVFGVLQKNDALKQFCMVR